MFKVITYNVMALENKQQILASLEEFTNLTERQDATLILAIQEARNINPKWPRVEVALEKALPDVHVSTHIHPGYSLHKTGLVNIAINALPVESVKIDFPRLPGLFWSLLFRLVRSEVPQHGALLDKYRLPDGEEVTVVNLHLDVFGGKKLKLAQAKTIKAALDKFGSEKAVVLGDFNAPTPLAKGPLIEEIRIALGQEFSLVGEPEEITVGIENTMSSAMPGHLKIHRILKFFSLDKVIKFRTDWIMIRNLKLEKQNVLTEHKGSDHYPVEAIVS